MKDESCIFKMKCLMAIFVHQMCEPKNIWTQGLGMIINGGSWVKTLGYSSLTYLKSAYQSVASCFALSLSRICLFVLFVCLSACSFKQYS